MEENVVSMFMDVKLDIRERKLEFSHLKSWTRYLVRIEAVKCFPCYVKISFFKSHADESTDLIVRINIPGLTVQMATSRTRAHSYGLFWKNNRKRCCAYFALPSQLLCERHLHWMKKSIRNLELYRQEILQLRRASRTPAHEFRQEMQPDPMVGLDLGLYQNLDLTENVVGQNVNDILGPLPNVPADPQEASVLSRRVSGMSGIYEEIFDPARASGSRMSRVSIASGIYEEMKLAEISEQMERSTNEATETDDVAPPLPPRPRSNTDEFEMIHRAFTTPESDYIKKKKHWPLFENMFGRRRANSGSSTGTSSVTVQPSGDPKKPPAENVIFRGSKIANLRLTDNKRNSFSSPDLSILKVEGGHHAPSIGAASGDNLSDGGGSCSSDFFVQRDSLEDDCFTSSELLHASKYPSIEESLANLLIVGGEGDSRIGAGFNVSQKIVSNFNGSCNTSTINLAGTSCMIARNEAAPPPAASSSTEGYCEMGAPGTGFNRAKLQEVELRKQLEIDSAESIYMSMNKEEASRSSSTSSGVSSIYSNISSGSSKQRNSIDDKIPSYYPNEDFRTTPKKPESTYANVKKSPKPVGSAGKRTTPRKLHITTGPASTMARMCKSAQKPSSSKPKVAVVAARCASSERSSDASLPVLIVNDSSPTKNIENSPPPAETTPKLYQKYATIARSNTPSTSSKYQEKNSGSKKGTDPVAIGSAKRFGSLPRFAKIDLSPLRLKINSVLQRHNSENL